MPAQNKGHQLASPGLWGPCKKKGTHKGKPGGDEGRSAWGLLGWLGFFCATLPGPEHGQSLFKWWEVPQQAKGWLFYMGGSPWAQKSGSGKSGVVGFCVCVLRACQPRGAPRFR